jgi:GMP synthase PP-ATPase subunit
MTADSVAMPDDLLREISARLMSIPEIAGVYYDLTHKPPGTPKRIRIPIPSRNWPQ